jgi:hypothetical protein
MKSATSTEACDSEIEKADGTQLKLIELQCDSLLKGRFSAKFFYACLTNNRVTKIIQSVCQIYAVYICTYMREQMFPAMKLKNNSERSRSRHILVSNN